MAVVPAALARLEPDAQTNDGRISSSYAQRRIPFVPNVNWRMAPKASRRFRLGRIRQTHRAVHAEGDPRGEGVHQLGEYKCRLRTSCNEFRSLHSQSLGEESFSSGYR